MTNRSNFTEAVPLSLSSMAHMTMPLEEGVLDGIRQVLQHTLLSCVHYARAIHAPHNWSFQDLGTSPFAWQYKTDADGAHTIPQATVIEPRELPISLSKLGFKYQYPRHCFIYLKPAIPKNLTQEEELKYLEEDWWSKDSQVGILGRVSLLYTTQELMTPSELQEPVEDEKCTKRKKKKKQSSSPPNKKQKLNDGDTDDQNRTENGNMVLDGEDEDDDPPPPSVLYKVVVEYRSLPATGNKSAVQAEELSMLSFGGSVDDDVKYGALAALYDEYAKYVLEIYSVRGKKYKFDLMDSTLSDGTVPRLPKSVKSNPGDDDDDDEHSKDPFVKSLCVTVTDHATSSTAIKPPVVDTTAAVEETTEADEDNTDDKELNEGEGSDKEMTKDDSETEEKDGEEPKEKDDSATAAINIRAKKSQECAITKIHLTMEGTLRKPKQMPMEKFMKILPSFHYIAGKIQESFLSLNHAPPLMATASPSGHTLLLDEDKAGKIYVNGQYVITWGKDPRIGSHFPALFGVDFHSVPIWHGRIFDYELILQYYGQLWQEILIDATYMEMNIAGRLLHRLTHGRDPPVKSGEKDDDYDDHDDDDDDDDDDDEDEDEDDDNVEDPIDTSIECLESQVMQSLKYDPVGIAAKALGTRFKMEYGHDACPCLAHEIDWVKDRLPGAIPVPVPARAINVLRRGGYFNHKRAADEIWFTQSRAAKNDGIERTLVDQSIALLKRAGCTDVLAEHIVFVSVSDLVKHPVRLKGLVRFNKTLRQYHVNDHFLTMDLHQILDGGKPPSSTTSAAVTGDDGKNGSGDKETKESEDDINLDDEESQAKARAYLLGLHIAQEHPDGNVLIRYLLRNRSPA